MLFPYFLVIVALIALLFATVTDIKTREVPDWLNYGLVIVGLGSRFIYSLISHNYNYVLYGFIGFISFFILANIMYHTKQWGGGDSKLLMGLGAMFGNFDNLDILNVDYKFPFLAVLIINIFIAGTIYGIIYSLFLAIKNHNDFRKEIKKRSFKHIKILFLVVLLLIILSVFILDGSILYLIIGLFSAIFFAYIILFFMKIVEDVSLYKEISIDKLTEGDWLVKDIIINKKTICKARNIGISKKDIALLKKNKVKKILVKEGMPFVPAFLLGFLITIFIGDLFLFKAIFF